MKKQLLTLAFLAATLPSFAGGNASVWNLADAGAQKPRIAAESFLTYNLRFSDLAATLKTAPQDPQRAVAVSLPMPDGNFETFQVWETPISTGDFYQKHPDLLTYTGTQKSNPQVTVKIDVGEGFFHAMILAGGKQYFIDPFSIANDGRYIVYDRENLSLAGRQYMACELEAARPTPNTGDPNALTTNGLTKRTYRLALACTGEYAQAATGVTNPTKAQVLAKMVTSVNRVNGIYEKEIAATLQLIPNTDTLIFLNGSTDPYTNSSGSAMLSQNQTTVTARIGGTNYDIGHVFSTGGGGIASLGALCSSTRKAQGVTGSPSPVGDAFDVDYVAHEMGHQFGGEHTFNANTGSCSGNGEPTAAYEPGSGSTIMAYAGICTGNDIQNNSDAYFHAYSLDQTTTEMTTAPVCGTAAATGNTIPALIQPALNYNIPWFTPFELTAQNPVSGTAVTYCWEEYDLGNFGVTYSNSASAGPIWRSFFPNPSPTRTFPSITTLIKNQTGVMGDQLSTVGRTMKFLLTVRNVVNGLGAFNSATNGLTTVTAIKPTTAIPDTFRILNLTSPIDTLIIGSQRTVNWDVSNSASAPINCQTVNIYYSIDSGRTWPYTLATGVPNTGSATFTVPNVVTTKGRIKVKASNNIFFAINRAVLRSKLASNQSVNALRKELQTKVYPVPTKDVLNVVLPEGISGVQAVLYNNMGQQIWKGSFESVTNTFPVQNYPAGTYYFRLQNVEQNFGETVPFVIQ